MFRRRLPPLWTCALVALLVVLYHIKSGVYERPSPPITLAFWGWLFTLASLIWSGIGTIAEATVAVLATSVNLLWIIVKQVAEGLAFAGSKLLTAFKTSWSFLRGLYDDVLKPAWLKFWKFIDWTRETLDRVFKPIFKVLFRIRAELLKFYDRFVRPVLATIDVARKILHVFSALGLDWAKKLDQQLAAIEAKIDAPFRLLLRELNKVINLVNLVVTGDGLFQRLALIRSIERDIKFTQNLWWNAMHRPATVAEKARLARKGEPPLVDQAVTDIREYLTTGGGPGAAQIDEAAQDVALRLKRAGLLPS